MQTFFFPSNWKYLKLLITAMQWSVEKMILRQKKKLKIKISFTIHGWKWMSQNFDYICRERRAVMQGWKLGSD